MTRSPRNPRPSPTAAVPVTSEPLKIAQPLGMSLCGALILCLFLMRFFYAAESADQGETLGIVGLWLVMLSAWAIVTWRSRAPIVRLGWLDLGLGLLIAGHIGSAIFIVVTSGDKRAAMNLAWEWLGLAIGWFLLRQQMADEAFRRDLLAGLIATGISVSALGLYQHYVEFPRMAAKYGPLFDRLKNVDPAEAAQLRKTLAADNIPTDGPGLLLFEKRLRDSREPLGFFALANSLGGLLVVSLILSITTAISIRTARPSEIRTMIAWVAMIVLIAWCLLLTKSRTAWIGTIFGLATLFYRIWGANVSRPRLRTVGLVLVTLTLAAWGLTRFGGLDRQVLTEAPKSLQYRLQYWVGTVRMIRDHAWLGVGPGQFRWHYLFYKLPEASEEISDPHNLLLDVAANGGMIAVAGLVIIGIVFGINVFHPDRSSTLPRSSNRSIVIPVVIGFTSIVWIGLLFSANDDRLLIVLPLTVVLFAAIRRHISLVPDFEPIGFSSASMGLLVHLCGAGGIGMPALSLLLMAVIAVSAGAHTPIQKRISPVLGCSIVVCSLGLVVALFQTGIRPVAIVQQRLFSGDRLVERGQSDAADQEYASAASGDRFSSEPWRRRAELAYRKAASEQFRSNDSFQIAVDLLHEAKNRDPRGFRDDRRLGEWWFARWQKTQNEDDIAQSVKAFQTAFDRYPTNAALMGELALTLLAAKSDAAAKEMAEKALNQDRINHERGHVDRFIEPSMKFRLEQLQDGQAGSAEAL